MLKHGRYCIVLGIFMAFFYLCGCGGANVKTSYYTINALAQTRPTQTQIADLRDYTLALGPVTLPAFITARAQIMAADGPNKLVMLENARWAEPLDTNLMLVLSDNFAYLLKPGNIIQYPWRSATAFDLRVEMTVFTLSADRDKAYLRARYTVTNVKTEKRIENEFNLTEPVKGFTAAEIVAAQNRLIDNASVVMAEDVAHAAGR